MAEKWTKNADTKIRFFLLLVLSIIFIILGFIFDPLFVSKHLSTDGFLSKATSFKIYFMQFLAIASGFVLLLYCLIKKTNAHFAEIIDDRLRAFIKKTDEKIATVLIRMKFIKKNNNSLLKYILTTWLIFLSFMMASGLFEVIFSWPKAVGWEYLWIAESIERGNGFSFADCPKGAYYYESGCEKFVPTAHEEPIYPYLLALATRIFGKYGRPAILMLQVVALFFTSVFLYHLALKTFNSPATGMLAGSVLYLLPGVRHLSTLEFVPIMFAGLMIVILTYLLFWCLDKPSLRRGAILGLVLGSTTLLYAPTLTFIPIFVLAILISKRSYRSMLFKTAAVVFLCAIIVMSVWTTRNFLVFGQIIPVRSGFGYFFLLSNPILAETFTSQSGGDMKDTGFHWKARNAREAVTLSHDRKKMSGLYYRFNEVVEQYSLGDYEENPIEIDKVAMNDTLKFIASHPKTFIALTYYRTYDFFFGFGRKVGLISLLFLVSSIILISSYKARILVLLVLVYAFPYVLILAWWYRYRYPIEPLMLILGCYLPVLTISKLYAFFRKPYAS